MSNHRYVKWWFPDWEGDEGLKLCSLAAQGLWMRLLCIAHKANPIGHVLIDGQPPSLDDVAELVGKPKKQIVELISELERRRVFSRTEDGVIYNRRMVRDEVELNKFRELGKLGGNPKLKGGVNPPDNGSDNGGLNRGGYPQYSEAEIIDQKQRQTRASPRAGPSSLHSEIMKLVHNQTNPFLKVKGHG